MPQRLTPILAPMTKRCQDCHKTRARGFDILKREMIPIVNDLTVGMANVAEEQAMWRPKYRRIQAI